MRSLDIDTPLALGEEVVWLRDLQALWEIPQGGVSRLDYNILLFCSSGAFRLESGSEELIEVSHRQLFIFPSGREVRLLDKSSDMNGNVLCISDKALKEVLGSQIVVWNEAMYRRKMYVMDAGWCMDLGQEYMGKIVSQGRQFTMYGEIMMSFLRTFMLLLCENFLQGKTGLDAAGWKAALLSDCSRSGELFHAFLHHLSHLEVKRHPVSYYAGLLCITPKYLSSVCRAESGKTPLKWISEYVLEDIYSLLRNTDLSIKEIAQKTGFPNPSFFGKFFCGQTGISPARYRRTYKAALRF